MKLTGRIVFKGGAGSGNFGHSGRPGKVGGSAAGSGGKGGGSGSGGKDGGKKGGGMPQEWIDDMQRGKDDEERAIIGLEHVLGTTWFPDVPEKIMRRAIARVGTALGFDKSDEDYLYERLTDLGY